jgi:tetratricopeptide (TPR) repeat protein
LPPPEQTGDRYQLQGEIARGGMGAVLRGRDVDLGRDLAVKVLLEKHADNPEVARRFLEEAQIGGQLQHPGVVPVYDVGRFGERPFFTMKLVKGLTLAALLSERSDPSADRPRFLGIALQVAQALAYAHAKGVIHRDLKPANVMVGAFGEVQVMDWGLAKVLAEGGVADEERAGWAHQEPGDVTTIRTTRSSGTAGSFGTDTEAGSLLGTPAYMPPEQANGDVALLDRRADVFGLGAILCEILTGKPPYVGRSSEEVRRKAANGALADALERLAACGADHELIALTKACLSPEAIDRPKDAQAVADGLSGYLNGVQERLQTAQREGAVALAREAEQRKRRKVQLALAAAVVALVVGGGAFAFWRNAHAQAGRERDARNAEAVAALLNQAEEALKADDAAKAEVALEAARKRSGEGGAEKEAERFGRLDADLALLRDLDGVDQFRWAVVDGKVPDAAVVARRTGEVMRRFGLGPEAAQDEAAARVSSSAVRGRIVSALDRLLRHEKTAGARALLRRVDAHPYRDAVRDAVQAKDGAKFAELAGRPEALEQPPGFVAFLGESRVIGVERRRQLLQAAVRLLPGDPGLLMALAGAYPLGQKDRANEKLRWYQAALAAAPGNAAALNGLGCVLCDDKRDRDAAIACFRRAIELDPKDAVYHYNLGTALKDKGRLDEAIACYRKALELDPKRTDAHTNLGLALERQKKVGEAITCWKKALALDANFTAAHTNLGIALLNKGQVDEAIACFRKALALAPKSGAAHYNLGNALHAKGRVDEAADCWKKALALDPNLIQAHISLGHELHRKGQWDEAIACFRRAIGLDPKRADAHIWLGNALGGKGKVDEAIVAYKKAIEIDPKDARAHGNVGAELARKGQLDEAIAWYKKAIALGPKSNSAHYNLGLALAQKGQVDEAIAVYRKAIALDPKDANAYKRLGAVLCDVKRDYDEAIACFKKATALDPKDAEAHGNLGVALSGKGKAAEAIACLRKAVALGPKRANAHKNLGTALYDRGRVNEAIASWRKAVELDPTLAGAHASLGGALGRKGRLDEAIACLRKAVALDPKHADAHANLGNALQGKGQLDEAIASWLKAVALDPGNTRAHANLGVALTQKGRWDEAVTCLRRAVALDPKDAGLHNNLGGALASKGELDEAIACWHQAIALDPKEAGAHINLGKAMQIKGRWEEAIACWKKVIELTPKNPSAHAVLGFALDKVGKPGEAIDTWRRSVALQPAQPNIWYWIARAEAKRGGDEEAARAFLKVRLLYPPGSPRAQAAQRFLMAKRLPVLLSGEARPADNAERLAFARIAHEQKHYPFAARLWAEALAGNPQLGDGRRTQHRYHAACSAALAAAGQGKGEAPLAAKAKLRGQALEWLKADLTAWADLLASGAPQARAAVVKALRHWQKNTDLVGLRDREALAKLPAEDRAACERLWADVAALLNKAQAPAQKEGRR